MENTQTQFITQHIAGLQQAILSGDAPGLVDRIIAIAAEERASDIHIEPLALNVRIRVRVDGMLHKLVEYATPLHAAVISRIKITANLKIDENRKPQDGRISIELQNGKPLDIRVSTFPTIYGEKIVMRLVDKSHRIPTLTELGLEGSHLHMIETAIRRPNGIILNTGPTGSGKSTTLYSCLSILNHEDVNILTLEDPVENQLAGLNQSQVKPDIGYTFATGLRTALRQDPDIMMVGEIRDKETLETAVEAALTGHLVLSTLHTNSAIETITRLLNMQVARYLITSTVQIIIAQRLARILCPQCMRWEDPVPVVRKEILAQLTGISMQHLLERVPAFDPQTFQVAAKGPGCEACNNLGYKGRLGIFEIVEFSEAFKDALLKEAPSSYLRDLASKEGTVFLRQDGIIRVLQGKTSLEEVYTVT